jgi:palmitoyltransferase ZDHHC9/14/18
MLQADIQTIASIYIVVFSAIHFLLICRHENVPFVNALRSSPGAAVSFLLGCIILPGMLFLLAYHVRVRLDSPLESGLTIS